MKFKRNENEYYPGHSVVLNKYISKIKKKKFYHETSEHISFLQSTTIQQILICVRLCDVREFKYRNALVLDEMKKKQLANEIKMVRKSIEQNAKEKKIHNTHTPQRQIDGIRKKVQF